MNHKAKDLLAAVKIYQDLLLKAQIKERDCSFLNLSDLIRLYPRRRLLIVNGWRSYSLLDAERAEKADKNLTKPKTKALWLNQEQFF